MRRRLSEYTLLASRRRVVGRSVDIEAEVSTNGGSKSRSDCVVSAIATLLSFSCYCSGTRLWCDRKTSQTTNECRMNSNNLRLQNRLCTSQASVCCFSPNVDHGGFELGAVSWRHARLQPTLSRLYVFNSFCRTDCVALFSKFKHIK